MSGRIRVSDLERARRFYIRARQARTGPRRRRLWDAGRTANPPCRDVRRGARWLGGVEALQEIAQRLLRVQIENRPAIDIVRLYDSEKTLFYCDPPYMHETRGDKKAYGFEMTKEQHWELAETLQQCKGRVAVSGYRCDPMDTWYKGWKRFDAEAKAIHSTKQLRRECVWMNY